MNPLGPNYYNFYNPVFQETNSNENLSADIEKPSLNEVEEQALNLNEGNAPHPLEPIATNLVSERPDWVPQTAVSKIGTLSAQTFLYLLDKQQIAQEKGEALKWFFQQRKFPPVVSCDSFNIPAWIDLTRLDTPVDREGYATTFSEHGSQNSKFIQDTHLLSIFPVNTIRYLDPRSDAPASIYPVGIYSDSKVMIQQQATRGCVAACAAMMVEDHQRQCNLRSLISTNLATDAQLISWLKEAGLDAALYMIQGGIAELESFIKQHGSVACAANGELGGHAIILDQIDSNQATIRDPFHGWRIAISTQQFIAMGGTNPSIVYVKSTPNP
ncbi:hypothetical protein PNK_0236 [Candidatus Protochlamydia naegleriophila]|uniref:Peptidase C39 domain-containing protein n=1 Tax=Candidatus Protochlamydia naegleriophila TaxID=389348 RepID=A0A0U5EPP6_9BACT|nr:cysteine peptidase family C39 domain-containing protein [Candidatus Protochlamydia naegleriophila]CUI15873.1 hypothetical protein PNK_0236 [Candidatus Protochlamydia naegleriophila]